MVANIVKRCIGIIVELLAFPLVVIASLLSRCVRRSCDVGIGPTPMINSVFHRKALNRFGYTAETFVSHVYGITDRFDVRADLRFRWSLCRMLYLYFRSLFTYRCLYFYFDGGPLGSTRLLWRIEPYLYRWAGIKTVLAAYGSDVLDLFRCPNLLYKHGLSQDYPRQVELSRKVRRKLELWSCFASHVIGGCDWVDYLPMWNTLMISHFAVDVDELSMRAEQFSQKANEDRPFVILHAPNHRQCKGSQYFLDAVEALKAEGFAIELRIVEGTSNENVLKEILQADMVADQLVIGWYAMFAIEAMALGRPVLCYLRDDLVRFYEQAGLLSPGDIPLIRCTIITVKEVIQYHIENATLLSEIGRKSQQFVRKYHSLEYVGEVFSSINRRLGILPTTDEIREDSKRHEDL